jgi:hypothetical protein
MGGDWSVQILIKIRMNGMSLPAQTLAHWRGNYFRATIPTFLRKGYTWGLWLPFVVFLLGFSPGLKEVKGGTPLHQAITKQADLGYIKQLCKGEGNIPIILALLEAGSAIEAQDDMEQTPLHVAARKGQTEAAAIGAKAHGGSTPSNPTPTPYLPRGHPCKR